jgi:phage shock protein C
MKKKLYRNSDERWLAGVLSGVADYVNIDVVVVRLLFIFFLIATGIMPGVLCYIIAWVVIPVRPQIEPVSHADYTVN